MTGSQLGCATFAKPRQAPSELNNLGVITALTSGAELGQKLGAPLGNLLDEQQKGLNSRVDLLVAPGRAHSKDADRAALPYPILRCRLFWALRHGASHFRWTRRSTQVVFKAPADDSVESLANLARRLLLCVCEHNLLFVGPPGSGKTLLARLMPTILPPLELDEAVECTAIHSVAGTLPAETGIVTQRPFRAPHHSVSEAGLVGGGDIPRPGEVSLAHHGVLFLDELAEFRRGALEALRQPLEDGKVCIARARARAWFPARPVLIAAVNPCPCGF